MARTRVLCIVAGATLLAMTAAKAAQGEFITETPDEIIFEATPLPGLSGRNLVGSPDQPGFYVMRIRFAPGIRTSPHSHDQDRYITVISGTWAFGTGDGNGCDGTQALPAGSFAVHPAGKVHYDGSCGDEVIVEISGIGPVMTQWLEPPVPLPAR